MVEPILFKLHNKIKEVIEPIKSAEPRKAFVMKVMNYDLLSVLTSISILDRLIIEATQVIKERICKIDHNYKYDVVSSDGYIIFITDHNISIADINFSYLIYRELQLHISAVDPAIILEYKISSFVIPKSLDEMKSMLQALLSQLIASKGSNFYIPWDSLAVERIKSNYVDLVEFKKSILGDTISFAYQPIVDRVTGNVSYYECLLRMPDHNLSRISAGPYIELAEQSGMNNVLDQIVLEMAVEELKAAPHVTLAVNISNAGILDENLKQLALSLLSERSVAKRLIIEITETSLNSDYTTTKTFIEAMRDRGCRVALDDFGAGFTSFQQLQNLRLDIIKIDGSFIRNVVFNQNSKYLLKALIEMAGRLGAKTVAEFVESAEIARFLLDVEIDYMQGDFFSPATNYRMWNKV